MKPVKSDDTETMYKVKIKQTFTGFKSYGNFGCVAFKNQTVTFKKLFHLGCWLPELSKLYMCKTYYSVLKPNLEKL